jgi:NTP pyrophosphatase (non-canonical NTP hydrolase)
MDPSTTIGQLKEAALRFRDARNWKQFHDPKNLSIGLAVEAAELQELFLWKTDEEVKELLASEKGRDRMREEIADVLVFLLYLSDSCGIDLADSVSRKIALNERKYPVDKSYNSNRKYDELDSGA